MVLSADELLAAIQSISDLMPYHRHLGLRLDGFGPEGVRVSFDKREEHIGNFANGFLHGGVISSVLDTVGGFTALATLAAASRFASIEDLGRAFAAFGTIDLRVDYLRPGAGRHFVAAGITLRSGRRIAVTRMELHDERQTLIAVGTGTYVTG